jgi:hypothetical protein
MKRRISINNDLVKPEAWVAVKNNRQKIYGDKNLVYLEDGQDFEIELFNSTPTTHLAKIYIDGKLISTSGLILYPGQRYFLDRFIDEKKKLRFSTYEVESGNPQVEKAIKDNGKIRVEFFPEQSSGYLTNSSTISTKKYPFTFTTSSISPNSYSGGNSYFINCESDSSVSWANSATYSTSSFNEKSYDLRSSNLNYKETGRIEKGENSEQSFTQGSGIFSLFFSHASEYQILPRSQKPVEVSEIRTYCTGCGVRVKKKSWRFCPSCGESLD